MSQSVLARSHRKNVASFFYGTRMLIRERMQLLRITRALSLLVHPQLPHEPNVLRHLLHLILRKLALQAAENVPERRIRKWKMNLTLVKEAKPSKRSSTKSWQRQRRRAKGPGLMHSQLPRAHQGAGYHGRRMSVHNQVHCLRHRQSREHRTSSSPQHSVPLAAPCSPHHGIDLTTTPRS